ncbi:hypothetical protein B0I27_10615 [Arcticibacter pallidicorallinus]|uniref:AsmA-like protein n=2 Tax=Arcticibacter pallidicorallinus TaxID=1259464 RepID=A0A2T0U2W5_9SPHI|nr:hypothetical protein B0I27_10615 [Arcticibacter pallidicorallinus]
MTVLTAGALFYFKFRKLDDFEPLIKAKLQKVVHDASGGLYKLDVEKINADVVNSRIILSKVRISYDSVVYKQMREAKQAPADVFDISLSSLAIDGLTPADLIKKRDIRLNILMIEQPSVHVYHHHLDYERPKKATSVSSLIEKEIGSFGLNVLTLKDVDFVYHNGGSKIQTSLKKLNVSLKDILINQDTEQDTSRFLYAKDATMSLKNFTHKTADSLYTFILDSITVFAARSELRVHSVKVQPRISKANYAKVMKARQDRYDVNMKDVVLEDIAWWTLLAGDGFYAGKASINGGSLEIYSDRTIPLGKSKKVRYPHQQLFESDMAIGIKDVSVKNLDITFMERSPETMQRGEITFVNTSASISNVTNIPAWVARNGILKIDANTRFMNEGRLKAGFRFNLRRQKEGVFSVYADLGPMSGLTLNRATRPLAAVEIKKAQISKLRVDINGNYKDARGKVLLTYHDLKVDVLKKGNDGTLKKRGLITFIANNFKINEQSPKKGEKAQAIDAYYQRPPDKSFFTLIWKTILAGVKESAGL